MVVAALALALEVTVRLRSIEGGGPVVRLPLEEYVAGVIAGEAASLPLEPRKAMAVAARTYAVRFRGRHAREGFDFCDTTHCQDYRGVAIEERSRAAAEATEGELLWRRGTLVETYYTKSCSDPWQRAIPAARIAGVLTPGAYRGPGRLATVLWNGRPLDATAFRFQLGTELLPSNWFDFRRAGNEYVFTGRGQGHGEGLCQAEAARLSLPYREILARYYPDSVAGLSAAGIAWRFQGGERVEVFTTRGDPGLLPLAEKLLREAEALAGFAAASRVRIRLYPSVSMFRDATGQPGSIAAFTQGTRIAMQPLPPAQLREVLAHELLHAVLESRAAPGHPWWFREGIVLALRNEQPANARYRDAQREAQSLLRRHGRGQVLSWWRRGLPREARPGGVGQ
jgi:stage II sporulation protein D